MIFNNEYNAKNADYEGNEYNEDNRDLWGLSNCGKSRVTGYLS
jgi:hypothetical protein